MDIGLPRQDPEPPDAITSLFAVWVQDALEVTFLDCVIVIHVSRLKFRSQGMLPRTCE